MKNNRAFHLLVFGQTFANMGDILYTIAVVSSVFTLTDSALAASLSPVIMTLGEHCLAFSCRYFSNESNWFIYLKRVKVAKHCF